jgi:hypothetical protein
MPTSRAAAGSRTHRGQCVCSAVLYAVADEFVYA